MTRPVLSSYNNIELPTINGDSGVWGTVLNNALNSLDDLIYANEQGTATNTAAIATLNANDQTSGSVDAKIAAATAAIRGTSTSTLSSLESLIGDAGNVDLSSINNSITNLQTNLGAPTNANLTTAVYPRVQSLESSISTLVGGTAGDDTKSVRTIATEVIGASNTGITSTAAQTLIDNSIAAVQGNTTQTIADLLALIQTLQGQVAQLQQDVTALQTSKASASSVTALENTVNGNANTTGLVTTVANVSSTATQAKNAANTATNNVSTLTTSVNGVSGRVTALENAGHITSSALAPYITTATANASYVTPSSLSTTLSSYATQNYVTSRGYLTSSNLAGYNYATQSYVNTAIANIGSGTNYVSTSDANWKKVRGLFEGQSDTNRTLPTALYLSNSISGYRNKITSYTSTNDPVFINETTSGANQTYKSLYENVYGNQYWNKLLGLFGASNTLIENNAPFALYLRQSATDYIRLDVLLSNNEPYLYYAGYHNGSYIGQAEFKINDMRSLVSLIRGGSLSILPHNLYLGSASDDSNYLRILAPSTSTNTWLRIDPINNGVSNTSINLVSGTHT